MQTLKNKHHTCLTLTPELPEWLPGQFHVKDFMAKVVKDGETQLLKLVVFLSYYNCFCALWM